jgi:xylono-1,5-lactonase
MSIRYHDAQCVWPAEAALGEGPIWIGDEAALYWVDILQGTLHRYSPARKLAETCALAFPITSIVPTTRSDFLCTGFQHLHRFDPRTGALSTIENLTIGTADTRINDGCVHPDGSFWFGTMDLHEQAPTGDFFRLDPNGTCRRIDAGFVITNGPTFSPHGETGYFVDTTGRRILQATINDGMPESFQPFATITDGYPDGITVDADGGIWCAHFGGHRVTRLDQHGVVTDIVRLPVPNATKCAFGGEHFDRLFITTARKGLDQPTLAAHPLAGGLFETDVGYRGIAPSRYRGGPRVGATSRTCFFESS